MPLEKIEILSVALLDEHRPTVDALKRLARSLGLEFGWHYLLDLTWILAHLEEVEGKRILDAGAGSGVMQWYLADQGAQVISVDRLSRADLPLRFRRRFRLRGLRPQDLGSSRQALLGNFARIKTLRGKAAFLVRDLVAWALSSPSPGQVVLYHEDLGQLPDLESNSIDVVVSVSALEHNPPDELQAVVEELMRLLKPGGLLLATLGAAKEKDWFHQPSQGWCYSEASLRRIFGLSSDVPSNYQHYDQLFESLCQCAELRDNLASFYFRSGDNGMPWGKWQPQYQPVGICKVKGTDL